MLDKHQNLPIYKKALEIYEITLAITDAIDKDDDMLEARGLMLSNASLIPAKIAGAEGAEFYSLRMENAVLIKLAACELKVQTNLLRMGKLSDESYIQLLRNAIDEFKPLFITWVQSFDPIDDINDGWLYISPPREQDMDD